MSIELDAALRQFAAAFGRSRLSEGAVDYREPVPVQSPVALGPVLTAYFSKLSLAERPQLGGALQMALFGPDELEGAQSGWRHIRDKSGRVVEDPAWPAHWVVIADRNGDAIFVDTSSDEGVTYGSIQKRNARLAGSLAAFLGCVADCVALEIDRFDYEVKDDDFNLLGSFLAEAGQVADRYLSADDKAAFLRFFFG